MKSLKEEIGDILSVANNGVNPIKLQNDIVRKKKIYEGKSKAIPFISEALSNLTDSQVQQVFNLINNFK